MQECIRLFKSLPVTKRTTDYATDWISKGVLIEKSIVNQYTPAQINSAIENLVPSNEDMNKTFHKSWQKIQNADLEQLMIEQVLHYLTTYGFQSIGTYSPETIYIPVEASDLDPDTQLPFFILNGITAEELKDRVQKLISVNIALSETDLSDIITVINHHNLQIDPSQTNNKELSVRLYDSLNMIPSDPTEFLRLQIYIATESSLLIKNDETIEQLKAIPINVFKPYELTYGLNPLASIFYRYKPLFLALKNKRSAHTVNKIRKLAPVHHKPMRENYMNIVTREIRSNAFGIDRLNGALKNAPIFQKLKLLQAIDFYRNPSIKGVIYKIRNGKAFTTTAQPLENKHQVDLANAWTVTYKSILRDLSFLEGKKIYIDSDLSVPTSGKMFCGNVPFGSSFTTGEALAVGISWKDVNGKQIDLDLSVITPFEKVGWDARYRNENILFSGDITAAPNGATEACLIYQKARPDLYVFNLNYYNAYGSFSPTVPFTLFVTTENEYTRMNKNSLVSKNNLLFYADMEIDPARKQKTIGILEAGPLSRTFYVTDLKTGNFRSVAVDERAELSIDYYRNYLRTLVPLCALLDDAQVTFVDKPEEADIDLSLKSLTKDKLISLITKE